MDEPTFETQTDGAIIPAGLRPFLVTAEQAAIALGICRTKVYELLRNGQLESVVIGSSRRIAVVALSEYVDRLRAQAAESAALPSTVLRRKDR